MRTRPSFAILALPLLAIACAAPSAEPEEDATARADEALTLGLDPRVLLPIPHFPGTPPKLRMPPEIPELGVSGQTEGDNGTRCYPARAGDPFDEPMTVLVQARPGIASALAGVTICEGARCLPVVHQGYRADLGSDIYTATDTAPIWPGTGTGLRDRTYTATVTSTEGVSTVKSLTFSFVAPVRAWVTGDVVESGPASGAGTRTLSIPFTGTNLDALSVWTDDGTASAKVFAPGSGVGMRSGTMSIPVTFASTDAYGRYVDLGRGFSVTGYGPSMHGCSSVTFFHTRATRVASTAPTPPGGGGGGSTPASPMCIEGCYDAVPLTADTIVTLNQARPTCGATSDPSLPNWRRECPIAGWPAGTRMNICSGQAIPPGWTVASRMRDETACVPAGAPGETNVIVIQKI